MYELYKKLMGNLRYFMKKYLVISRMTKMSRRHLQKFSLVTEMFPRTSLLLTAPRAKKEQRNVTSQRNNDNMTEHRKSIPSQTSC